MAADQRVADAGPDYAAGLAVYTLGLFGQPGADAPMDEIRRLLPETRFAWSGPTTREPGREGGAYFRIHGPTLLIEHAPQGNQGGYKVHVHTVMRNLGNDYAAQLV